MQRQLSETQPKENHMPGPLRDFIYPNGRLSEKYAVTTYARIQHMEQLLPHALNRAVKIKEFPDRSLATVWMLHPRQNDSGQEVCYMVVELLPYRAEIFGKSICDVNFEIHDGLYCLVVPGIGKIQTSEHLIVRGSTKKNLIEIFGPQVANGIEQTRIRQREKRVDEVFGDCTTKCIQLMIPRDPASPSFLVLGIEPTLGIKIAQDIMVRYNK